MELVAPYFADLMEHREELGAAPSKLVPIAK
jgi:hypothetical protein